MELTGHFSTGTCRWEESIDQASAEFNAIVDGHYAPLYKFAFSLSHSEADALDLTQQTFYTWARKRGQLRDPSKAKAWLFTTLHRAFLQAKRRQTRFPHCDLEDAGSELPAISPPQLENLDSGSVLKALSQIDETFRAPLSLFYLEDYPYKEIAEILEVPIGTVKSRISRGIVQLKKLLGAKELPVPATTRECSCLGV